MTINQGEIYELQVTAGNLAKDQSQIVTLSIDPDKLNFQSASSFEEEADLKEGGDGVKLLKYQPKKRRYGSKVDRKHGTREFL